jgi:ABC-type glycerol-3-phosphate transport system substrate-binding protein
VPMGPWLYSYRATGDVPKEILEQKTGVIPLPLPPGGKQATYLEVKPIMINANSKDKEAAWALVKALAGKDYIAINSSLEGVNPPRKDVSELPEFKENWWQKAFVAQLETGVALAPVNWGLVVNDITGAIQKVIYQSGQVDATAKELLSTLTQRAENNQL